jgi:hypothetical protein
MIQRSLVRGGAPLHSRPPGASAPQQLLTTEVLRCGMQLRPQNSASAASNGGTEVRPGPSYDKSRVVVWDDGDL